MDWQQRLISIYLIVCESFDNHLWQYCERFSNNRNPTFSDQEVITLYLFGIIDHRTTVKDIHRHAVQYLNQWFPQLPRYEAFNARLSFLCSALEEFLPLLERMINFSSIMTNVRIIDSMPIILAKNRRSDSARVAPMLCDKGYCSSKNLYFYGMKLHAIVLKGLARLPRLEHISFSSASEHDVRELRNLASLWNNCDVYGDKAYFYHDLDKCIVKNNVNIYTPIQRVKNDPPLNETQLLWNTSVSRMRQPIESFFNWLQEKTAIQNASKVRSTKGLLVHLFGRIAAALFLLIFNS